MDWLKPTTTSPKPQKIKQHNNLVRDEVKTYANSISTTRIMKGRAQKRAEEAASQQEEGKSMRDEQIHSAEIMQNKLGQHKKGS